MTNPEEAMQIELAKKEIMRKVLTKEALERLARVKLANPMTASQLESYLIQVYQSGQLKEQIDDPKLKQILSVLTESRKTKIKRK
jgi:programmed cell death protein 5